MIQEQSQEKAAVEKDQKIGIWEQLNLEQPPKEETKELKGKALGEKID